MEKFLPQRFFQGSKEDMEKMRRKVAKEKLKEINDLLKQDQYHAIIVKIVQKPENLWIGK